MFNSRDEAKNIPNETNQEVTIEEDLNGSKYKRRVVLSTPEKGKKIGLANAVRALEPDTSSMLSVVQDGLLWVVSSGCYMQLLRLVTWLVPESYVFWAVLVLAGLPLAFLYLVATKNSFEVFLYRIALVFVALLVSGVSL